MSVLISILAFFAALGLLIAIHEFGHYWVAKKLGVKVLRFSIGFGKPLFSKRLGADQTEYVVSMLPLGGYVKMLDERDGEVAEEEKYRAFNRQPLSTRTAIVAAGPVFNFLFAILAYWIMFTTGVPGVKAIAFEVEPASYAAEAGMQAGDQIISVAEQLTPTWEAARFALLNGYLNQEELAVQVLTQDGREKSLLLDLTTAPADAGQGRFLNELGIRPATPPMPAVIGRLETGGPAEKAGVEVGDKVLSANSQKIDDWSHWVDVVRANPGKTLNLQIERVGDVLQLTITPGRIESDGVAVGRIGAAPQGRSEIPEEYKAELRYGLFAALSASLTKTWDASSLTLQMLGKMIVGEASLNNLSGPITIAQYAGYTASVGLTEFLSFLAIISISLGVLNLLPIPLLDGGHLMFYLIEFVKGSPLSAEAQLIGQRLGVMFLMLLMSIAFYNDIARLVG